jgi:hypothetical protein
LKDGQNNGVPSTQAIFESLFSIWSWLNDYRKQNLSFDMSDVEIEIRMGMIIANKEFRWQPQIKEKLVLYVVI